MLQLQMKILNITASSSDFGHSYGFVFVDKIIRENQISQQEAGKTEKVVCVIRKSRLVNDILV